ncbi:MAG: peroxiredoxin family protein [Planctomycetota bacterium]|jgi:cytochrome oxidase Cu insertion factor (SCO1/SenC/PrrC family)
MREILIGVAAFAATVLPAGVFAQTDVPEGYNVGERCPDFERYDSRGNLVRLSQFRGKVVLLHFLATW